MLERIDDGLNAMAHIPAPEPFCIQAKYAELANKVNEFIIFCVLNKGSSRTEASTEATFSEGIFTYEKHSVSFVLWDDTYKQSKDVFAGLRIAAREQAILSISRVIFRYLMQNIGEPRLGKSGQMDVEKGISAIQQLLKQKTFLMEDSTWEDFCKWSRMPLMEWVFEKMERHLGLQKMSQLEDAELNELFYEYLTKSIAEDQTFTRRFASIANEYAKGWVRRIVRMIDVKHMQRQELASLLGLSERGQRDYTKQPIKMPGRQEADVSFIQVMSNAPYQYAREALYKKNFSVSAQSLWPSVDIKRALIEGSIRIIPVLQNKNSDEARDKALSYARDISDLDVDLFDALCSLFLESAKHMDDRVEIYIDDLLLMRGLKPKLGGEGRRGGYEQKQREQVLKSLTRIQSLWLDLRKMVMYDKGAPTVENIDGRTFLFTDEKGKRINLEDYPLQQKISFGIDKVFGKFLFGSGRQVALLPTKSLQYHIHHYKYEKRLSRYLSWRWRTQARKGQFMQPHKIATLLDAIGEKVNDRLPSRTKERMEKALDLLCEDGIISSWQYDKWDETAASFKGWRRKWLNSTIIISPPAAILNRYSSIQSRNKKGTLAHNNPSSIMPDPNSELAENIRIVRRMNGLTLKDVSLELDISTSYLSNIERGIKRPSVQIQHKIHKWLEMHGDHQLL
ncbi:helix-turn-helix domain-containing protein [Bacillus testis]|uniref:helix-turn-helix domain-containing protein n=1 Tax=Bacillus testis TaxID=1622072 RepID=UPI00067F0B23|nr:helix-turn-helix transcriptional regulator [Bacillus testis]